MNNEPDASLRRERVKSAPGGRVLWAPGKERGEREAYCAIETPHSTEQHVGISTIDLDPASSVCVPPKILGGLKINHGLLQSLMAHINRQLNHVILL